MLSLLGIMAFIPLLYRFIGELVWQGGCGPVSGGVENKWCECTSLKAK